MPTPPWCVRRPDRYNTLVARGSGTQICLLAPFAEKLSPWRFPEGLLRPLAKTPLESITCRSTAAVWFDVFLEFPPKAISLSLSLSYSKIMPESTLSGLTPASTPMTGAGVEDLWSDEEDEDNSRLHFTWHSPLSIVVLVFHTLPGL